MLEEESQTTEVSEGQEASGSNEQTSSESKSVDEQTSNSEQSSTDSESRSTKTDGVPSEYTLTLDDDSPLKDEAMDEIAAYARQHGLSNKQAQDLLDRESKMVSEYRDDQLQAWDNTQKQWVEAAKADKEIGGDNFSESAELAKRVIQRYGTEELNAALNQGYGNHPEIIRVFSRIGKELQEKQLITGDGPVGKFNGKSTADTLYGG